MKKFLFVFAMALGSVGLTGCATPNETMGTVGGAAVGGVAGNVLTGGSAVGTIGGAAIGGLVGHEVGESADERNRRRY